MRKFQFAIICILALTFAVSSAMEKLKKHGKGVPEKTAVTKLSDIVKEPQKFKNKEVVLQGNFVNICCATDFVYREGLESIEIYPQNFPIPKLDRGKPIKIWGIVRIIEKESAKAEEDSTKTEESADESSPIIYIDALGMESK